MTNTFSPELQAKIEQDAEHYANVQIGEKAKFIQHSLSGQWDIAKEAYEDGYKAALQAAELQLEQMAKALERISNQEPLKGREGCTFGDTNLDSMSVATGYNNALEHIKPIANQAITNYNKYMNYKKAKDGE